MNKVLIIGFMWPYHNRGSGRVLGLAKYLPQFGWEPVVITVPLNIKPDFQFRVVEIEYKSALDFWLGLFKLKSTNTSIRGQVKQFLGVKSKKNIRSSFIDFAFTRVLEVFAYPDLERGWKHPAIRAGEKLFQKEDIKAVISTSPPYTTNLIAKELKKRYKIPWLADFPHIWSQDESTFSCRSLR